MRNKLQLEKEYLKYAREALRALLMHPDERLLRKDLFKTFESNGPAEKTQGRALFLLEQADLISSVKTGEHRWSARKWQLKDHAHAAELVGFDDTARLAAVLYAYRSDVVAADVERMHTLLLTPVNEEEGRVDVEPSPPPPAAVVPAPSENDVVLEALLVVLKAVQAVGESLHALHSKVDKLPTAPGAGLEAVMQELLAETSKLREERKLLQKSSRLGEADTKTLSKGAQLVFWAPEPEPVTFVEVSRALGHPPLVSVSRADGTTVHTTPKFLSMRSS